MLEVLAQIVGYSFAVIATIIFFSMAVLPFITD